MILRILIIAFLCAISGASSLNEILRSRSILYGISSLAKVSQNFSQCNEDLKVLFDATNNYQHWAFKVLDASGVPGSGYLNGNSFWVGSRVFCEDLQNRKRLKLNYNKLAKVPFYNHTFPPYTLGFVVALIKDSNNTLRQEIPIADIDVIKLGLCVPETCDTKDVAVLLETYFERKYLSIQTMYNLNLRVMELKKLRNYDEWIYEEPKVIFGIVLAMVIILITACGTIYGRKHPLFEQADFSNNNNMNGHIQKQEKRTVGFFAKLGDKLRIFDIVANSSMLFNTSSTEGNVHCVHGLRFFGMLYVILAHSILYNRDFNTNLPSTMRLSEQFLIQMVTNCNYLVDGFFFLGGFLLSYIYCKQSKDEFTAKIKGSLDLKRKIKNFFLAVTCRYVRLTPAYFVVILLTNLVFTYLRGIFPVHFSEEPDVLCDKFWWRNILYINNLYPRSEMCLSWSYYLSNDMQFFILSFLILILSTICFKTAVFITIGIMSASIGIYAYVLYKIEYIPTLDEFQMNLDAVYDVPWIRINPYLIGLITGYLLVVRMNNKLELSKKTLVILWILFPLLNLWIMFGLYGEQMSLSFSIFYMSISRTLWAIGLAWIVIACHTNNGGILNRFLSSKLWVPLSKMSLCAYLLNPTLIAAYGESSNSYSEFSYSFAHIHVAAIWFATYLFGYIASLLFECPFANLFKKSSAKKPESRKTFEKPTSPPASNVIESNHI